MIAVKKISKVKEKRTRSKTEPSLEMSSKPAEDKKEEQKPVEKKEEKPKVELKDIEQSLDEIFGE